MKTFPVADWLKSCEVIQQASVDFGVFIGVNSAHREEGDLRWARALYQANVFGISNKHCPATAGYGRIGREMWYSDLYDENEDHEPVGFEAIAAANELRISLHSAPQGPDDVKADISMSVYLRKPPHGNGFCCDLKGSIVKGSTHSSKARLKAWVYKTFCVEGATPAQQMLRWRRHVKGANFGQKPHGTVFYVAGGTND